MVTTKEEVWMSQCSRTSSKFNVQCSMFNVHTKTNVQIFQSMNVDVDVGGEMAKVNKACDAGQTKYTSGHV